MQKGERATHVWQHLYDLAQRWDELTGTNIQVLREESEQCGCPRPAVRQRSRLPSEAGRACTERLQLHHDLHYGPAYLRELSRGETRTGRQLKNPQRLWCCTPRGVLVSVGLLPPRCVLTAFRPEIPYKDSPTDEDYLRKASRRWKDGTCMANGGAWKAEILQALTAASARPPERTAEVWEWVWAIGQARILVPKAPELAAPLHAAEAMLEQRRPEVVRLLREQLRTGELLANLEAFLGEEQPDEAEDALLALEEVLVVAGVLGLEAETERILEKLSRLGQQWPPALTGFDTLARHRLAALGTSAPEARALWTDLLRSTSRAAPSRMPERLRNWLTRLEDIRASLSRKAEGFLARGVFPSVTLEPVVTLGTEAHDVDAHVEGVCPPGWQLRLVLVDVQQPEGVLLQERDYSRRGAHWSMDYRMQGSGDAALLIAFCSPVPPEGQSLEELMRWSSTAPEVWITEAVLLSPPSERRP